LGGHLAKAPAFRCLVLCLQNRGKFFRGNVLLCWAGKWGVCVWQDVIVEKYLFVEVYEFVDVDFNGAGVSLFDHIPKLFGFIL
jgi:hypothetical protein